MRERRGLWVVLAGIVVGAAVTAAVAAGAGGRGRPARLPALASAGGARAAAGAEGLGLYFPVRYEVEGELPDLASSAPAYTLGRDAAVARVADLARALGLGGGVREVEDAWVVRDGGRELRVERSPGLPWYFVAAACLAGSGAGNSVGPDGAVNPDGSARAEPPCGAGGSAGSAGPGEPVCAEPGTDVPDVPCRRAQDVTVVCPMPPCPSDACVQVCPAPPTEPLPEPQRPAGMPSQQEAERTARDLLARAGLDLTGAAVRVTDGVSAWYVSADPVVDGFPVVGMAWSVTVGPEGVIDGATGWLATPRRGDTYPLAGTAVGLERLRTHRFFGGPEIMALAPECVDDCPRATRRVTGVRLGLLFAPVAGADAAMLVPAYLFELDGGEFVPVLAVADEFLPYQPEPVTPERLPLPAPSDPTPAPASGAGAPTGTVSDPTPAPAPGAGAPTGTVTPRP